MLEAVLTTLNNWFDRDERGRFHHVESGALSIKGGALLDADAWLKEGQYFRILGSTFNDGLHQHPAELKDEAFDGCAYALAIPQAVIELAERIAEWEEANGDATRTPYSSESFGGYSYSLKSGEGGASWQATFANELRGWRKI